MAEGVGEAALQECGHLLALLVGETRILAVRLRVLQVYLFVCHIEVATEDDRLRGIEAKQVVVQVLPPSTSPKVYPTSVMMLLMAVLALPPSPSLKKFVKFANNEQLKVLSFLVPNISKLLSSQHKTVMHIYDRLFRWQIHN